MWLCGRQWVIDGCWENRGPSPPPWAESQYREAERSGGQALLAEKNVAEKGSAATSHSKRMATNLPEKTEEGKEKKREKERRNKKRQRLFFSLVLPFKWGPALGRPQRGQRLKPLFSCAAAAAMAENNQLQHQRRHSHSNCKCKQSNFSRGLYI